MAVLTVRVTSPGGTNDIYTTGSVTFQVEVGGGIPEKLELLDDGVPFAELKAPYIYVWDARDLAEGSRIVTARATLLYMTYLSGPLRVVIDRTPPMVTSQTPAPGSTDVDLNDPVQVVFSESVLASSLNESSVFLLPGTDSDSIASSLSLSGDGMTLTITPIQSLRPPYTLTATLKDAITDLAGNALALPMNGWTWSVPLRCATNTDCPSDASCKEGSCRAVTVVDITRPVGSGTIYTKGSVDFQVMVTGQVPDKVELLSDGVPFASLKAPYAYRWDTTALPEGRQIVVARATVGSTTFNSVPVTVVVDRTPPAIVSRMPAPGDANAWVKAPIEVLFSEPVNVATLNDNTVSAVANGSMALGKSLNFSADGRKFTVTLASTPILPCTVTITLGGAITDLAGNSLSNPPDTWTFTMPSWWAPWPVPLSKAMLTNRLSVVLDSAGKPTVAWTESTSAGRAVVVKRWDGTEWRDLGQIRIAADASSPNVKVDSSGAPVLVWEESSGAPLTSAVYAARWNGSAWTSLWGAPLAATQAIFTTTFTSTGAVPSVGVDSTGNVIVSATVVVGAIQRILVKKWDSGSGIWIPLGDGPSVDPAMDAFRHSLAVGPGGNPAIAWIERTRSTGGTGHIAIPTGSGNAFVQAWNGSKWTQQFGSAPLNTSGRLAYDIELVVDKAGMPIVAWNDLALGATPADYTLSVARWAGAKWECLGPVNPSRVTAPSGSSLAVMAGNPVIAFAGDARQSVYQVQHYVSGVWTPIGGTVGGGGGRASSPSLVVTSDGTPVIGYSRSWPQGGGEAMLATLNQ